VKGKEERKLESNCLSFTRKEGSVQLHYISRNSLNEIGKGDYAQKMRDSLILLLSNLPEIRIFKESFFL